MKAHQLQKEPIATHLLAMETGESVMELLQHFAIEHEIEAGRLSTGIGAFQETTLAFFDMELNSYEEIFFDEQLELLSLHGTISRFEGAPKLHLHAALSRRDGSCVGGHLVDAIVRPTVEILVTSFPAILERTVDPKTGLALLY